jgi:hypothetical protein
MGLRGEKQTADGTVSERTDASLPLLELDRGSVALERLAILVVDPAIPAGIGHLELLDIPGRWDGS